MTRTTSAKRPGPITLDAYVRVSDTRNRLGKESFISPVMQRERIAAWAQAHGHRIGKVHEEMDVSGASMDRPKLNAVMARIEAGETGGVVVFKLDRFGRTLIDSLGLIERIEKAGGTFASVSDGFDLSTETGRLVLRIMLSLAEFELERIRGNWNEARERAIARGIHLAATVPFGYQRRADGGLEAHPVNGPVVTELFERRAGGASWADLRRFMEVEGALTALGRETWTMRAMRDIVRSDVYLGVASHGEFRKEGAHDALTDAATWRRAQRRGHQTTSRADEPALLAGVLRCAGCRYVMRAATRTLKDGQVVHDYRCRCSAEQAGRCLDAATATGSEGAEAFIVDAFFARIDDLQVKLNEGATLDVVADRQAVRDDARLALEAYAGDARVQAALGMDAYVAGLEARRAVLDEAQRELDAANDSIEALPGALDAMSVRRSWRVLTVDEKRQLLASVIDCVFVRRRAGRESLADRTRVLWRGETVGLALPGQGKRGYSPVPFLFDADPLGAGKAAA
jgi:DNA invertase Pin-like site-specific DNA recombinase